LQPSSPKVLLNTATAAVLGILLGIAAAVVRELSDRRLRSPDEVVEVMGFAVVGVLPKPSGRRLVGANRPTLTQQRMVARLAAPAKTG
jgi:capsular polysaccharide biosynthesis protein